jgi:hypothetical protein
MPGAGRPHPAYPCPVPVVAGGDERRERDATPRGPERTLSVRSRSSSPAYLPARRRRAQATVTVPLTVAHFVIGDFTGCSRWERGKDGDERRERDARRHGSERVRSVRSRSSSPRPPGSWSELRCMPGAAARTRHTSRPWCSPDGSGDRQRVAADRGALRGQRGLRGTVGGGSAARMGTNDGNETPHGTVRSVSAAFGPVPRPRDAPERAAEVAAGVVLARWLR